MGMPLVTFAIATHNRGRVLVECLEALRGNVGLARGAYEVLVVDNASTDGTAALAAEVPGVRVIRLDRNEGPVAKNHAIAQARGAYTVVMDDDAYPLPGAVEAMLGHLAGRGDLGAAVFDVMLPDGSREASAYPDVFIGAGTGFRTEVVRRLGGLPTEFFMQAEEYDLSFRLLEAGLRVERFEDMPLRHLKSPGARIATRTTRLDVRNNLYVLAKYVPSPLCWELAADWLQRYFMMAQRRDEREGGAAHRAAYMQGSAEGMARWGAQRKRGRRVSERVIEQMFRFAWIREELAEAQRAYGLRRVVLADFGKNMLAVHRAVKALGMTAVAIADDGLAPGVDMPLVTYRGTPVLRWAAARGLGYDGVVVANLSPVQGPRRAAALRGVEQVPVVELGQGVCADAA